MKIYLNGDEIEVSDHTMLADVVVSQGLPEFGIAVAVDNKVVPKGQWAVFELSKGSRIIIIKAVCGG